MVKSKKAFIPLLIGCLLGIGLTGCSDQPVVVSEKSAEKTDVGDQSDYRKKHEILDQVQSPYHTALGTMSQILTNEWRELFTAKDEEDLYQRYEILTWHSRNQQGREKLRNTLEQHKDYLAYKEMYENGLLPARSVKLVSMSAEQNRPEGFGYRLTAAYELVLKDKSTKEVQVELEVSDAPEGVSPLMYTDESPDDSIQLSEDPKEQQRQDFLLRLLREEQFKVTREQLLELLK